jgi:hypothetical protein
VCADGGAAPLAWTGTRDAKPLPPSASPLHQ